MVHFEGEGATVHLGGIDPGCIHNVAIHNVAIHNVAGNIFIIFLFLGGGGGLL